MSKSKCETLFEVSRHSLLQTILKGFRSQIGLKLGEKKERKKKISSTLTVNKRKHGEKGEGKLYLYRSIATVVNLVYLVLAEEMKVYKKELVKNILKTNMV